MIVTGLSLEHCDVFYNKAQALHGVSMGVRPGEIVGLVGRNGAGKSTLLRALMGLLPVAGGRRILNGEDVSRLLPHEMNRLGVGYVPEDRQVFPNLTVDENLQVAKFGRKPHAWPIERVYELFPRLKERRGAQGGVLSGGEQQMLAIGRALMSNPRILLLDEPTEGLAPVVVGHLMKALMEIRRDDIGVLLVEQNLRIPLELSDTIVVIDVGHIKWSGDAGLGKSDRRTIEQLIAL